MGFIVLAAIAGALIFAIDQSASKLAYRLSVYAVGTQGRSVPRPRDHITGAGRRGQARLLADG